MKCNSESGIILMVLLFFIVKSRGWEVRGYDWPKSNDIASYDNFYDFNDFVI